MRPIRTKVRFEGDPHTGFIMTYGWYLRFLTWAIDTLYEHKEGITERLWDKAHAKEDSPKVPGDLF